MTQSKDSKVSARAIIGFIGYIFLNPFILFINAGTIKWGMAWAYFGVSITATIISRVLAHRKNPDLLEERARAQDADNVKKWDRVLVPIAALYAPIAAIIVAGLDWRNSWSDVIPLWVQILALFVATLGFIFASWAMIENRFFSAMVRIQEDRGHTVCDTGPYQVVRHPGYAGGLIWYLMTPLVLNSMWAYIPTGISLVATIIRTALEDKTLQEELAGYKEFTQKTRFRLFPGVW